jgi:uncharacterized membrane protein YdjX (TVP38/TMEM64 family)
VRTRPLVLLCAGGLVLACAAAGLASTWTGLAHLARLLAAGDAAALRDHLRGLGPWAPLASFAFVQLQAIVAPLPSFPLVYANGLLYGTLWGGLLSWASVLTSALLCFGLARLAGRPLVERVVSPAALRRTAVLFERYGVLAVFLGRLLPLTAFDLLSYAAGLTPMRLGPFTVATALGMTPAVFAMAAAGDLGRTSPRGLLGGLVALGVLASGAALLAQRVRGRLAPRPVGDEPEG